MPRNRGPPTIRWIPVNVMAGTVSMQHTPGPLQFADEVAPLHTSNSNSCRSAGAGGSERSRVTISS
jgi:hypothetical protein